MGTLKVLDFRKGPEDADVVLADLGGATALTLNGGSAKYKAAAKAGLGGATSSSFGLRLVTAGANLQAYVERWPFAVAARDITLEMVFSTTTTALSTATSRFVVFNDAGTIVGRVIQGTGATPEIYITGLSGSSLSIKTGCALGTQYVLNTRWVVNETTAASGTLTAELYLGSDAARASVHTTPGSPRVSTTFNLGTAALSLLRVGVNTNVDAAVTADTAMVRAEDNRGSLFTSAYTPSANQPPTVAPIAVQIGAVGSASTFTCVATDPDGSVASYAWTVTPVDGAPYTTTGLNSATLAITPTTNAGVGARYDISVVAIDNAGAPSAAVTTRLLVPGTVIRPILEGTANGWVAFGATDSAANRLSGIQGNASDSTGVQAPSPADGRVAKYRLAPLVAASGWSMVVDNLLTAAASGVAKVGIMQGNDVRLEWNVTGIAVPTTSKKSPVLTNANNTAGAIASITDFTELDLTLTWAAS